MKLYALFFATAFCVSGCRSDNDLYYDVVPPFAGVAPATDTLEIDPAKEQTVKMPGGATVSIPANAFTDANGNTVTKPVQLTFTNYDTKAKILASGIPMKYNEGGKQYDFESAGMFDIQGYAGGEKINIAKDKKVEVSYPSAAKGEYDFFVLDGKDAMAVTAAGFGADSKPQNSAGKWRKLTNVQKEQLTPEKSLKDFKLKFNTIKYPSLAEFASVDWHLANAHADPTSTENKWAMDTAWDYLELSKPKYISGRELFRKRLSQNATDHTYEKKKNHTLISAGNNTIIWHPKEKKIFEVQAEKCSSIFEHYPWEEENCYSDEHFFFAYQGTDRYLFNATGERLGKFNNVYKARISGDQQKIVHQKLTAEQDKYTTITIAKLNGEPIKEFTLSCDNTTVLSHYDHTGYELNEYDELITYSPEGVSIYDLNGKLLHEMRGKYYEPHIIDSASMLLLTPDKKIVVWNYKANTKKELQTQDGRSESYYASFIVSAPFVRYFEDGKTMLWNYQTNETIPLVGFYCWFDNVNDRLLWGYTANSFLVYDIDKGKYILDIALDTPLTDHIYAGARASKKNDRLLISPSPSLMRLYSKEGVLLKDFCSVDTNIEILEYTNDGNIFTISKNGTYREWDMNGKLLHTRRIANADATSDVYNMVYGLTLFNHLTGNNYLVNDKGELMHALSADVAVKEEMADSFGCVTIYKDGTCTINDMAVREEPIYHLTLNRGKRSFSTDIYLDARTKKLIDKYNATGRREYLTDKYKSIQLERKMQEEQLAAEDTLLRIFAIAEFGIYNYDRIIETDERLFFAADLNLPGIEKENVTIFLVTKMDGNAVVKYDRQEWARFSIDTTVNNTLIAILPGNEIAMCTEEELKRINWGSVANAKAYTFEMKRTGKKISSMKDLEELL